ncbi:MAG TPA: ABC transporter ATP-binding protein, partial [Alphaproteobacteria bacterium]|nr:ABC transporter ATP-binding protein [Alphaproteobacteria bacterium]
IDAYNEHSLIKAKAVALQSATNQLPRMVLEVLFIAIFVVTICVLCLEHETPVTMMGTLGGYLYVGFRVMPGLNRILNQLNTVKSSTPYIERVYKEYTTLEAVDAYVSVKNFSFKDSLKIQNVFYRYPNTAKDVLEDISLEIKKGSCVGIIGQTGSGKSTLVDLVLGLLKPTKGSILIDNKYPVNCQEWHKHIGYVPQSIYLIDDTIEANIVFGDNHVDEVRLNEAVKASQLGRFIEKLPSGVKTLVGERGVRLSGGERQRIAIARALYRNPDVLIFDEATSALDNETEARLMETIHKVSQNRTVIMIAHRLTTLRDCSSIIHLENGVMKDVLTYDQLINKENVDA